MINIEFLDASFILLLCFSLFMYMALRFGYRKSLAVLDSQIAHIKETLDLADERFAQAKSLLEQEMRIKNNLHREIKTLEEKTNHHIEIMKKQSEEETAQLLEARHAVLDQMIDHSRLKTVNDMKIVLSTQVEGVLKDLMMKRLPPQIHESLNQGAIERLEQILEASSSASQGNLNS